MRRLSAGCDGKLAANLCQSEIQIDFAISLGLMMTLNKYTDYMQYMHQDRHAHKRIVRYKGSQSVKPRMQSVKRQECIWIHRRKLKQRGNVASVGQL